MKNRIYFFAVLMSLILLASCSKSNNSRTLAVPAVTTGTVTNIAGPTATIAGEVTDDGGAIVTAAGICYDTVSGVTISKGTATSPHTISGSYAVNLSGLTMGKTYYYKAYATNAMGTSYGDEQSFYAPVDINGYTASSQIAPDNLVAYWAFEGGYVDSVSNTVGTPNHPSAISFVTGLKGKAVEVASPGYINSNITNTIANLGSFTVACWIKHPSNLDPGGTLFTYMPWSLNQAGYSWEQTKFFMLFNNADNSDGSYGKVCMMDQWFDIGQKWPAMLDGNWHHLAISFNGSTGALRVYVDGTLFQASQSVTLTPQTNFGSADSFTLGGPDDNANAGNGWMNSLSGDLDEFKTFNKELSVDEIQALYILEKSGL
ncbi:MAG: LamG domain-containing protein [Chitinophagaceae bacterium]|jgi:hypothetical protein|nr:LamG domain-containing protein [Chitinophagaceae bacterium]